MKIKDILAIVAVALMAVGCSSDDGLQPKQGRVPISLTASINSEVVTRGYQEENLVESEKVYVWGKEGSGNYDYLQAWTLTAGADGALSGSAKYYPLSGETLTMVALHGNFSYTEGTALPASISHSVELDQSSTGNYEKSDLLWATVSGSSADATGKNLAFTHELSKIEIKLHPGEGYSDISAAEVRLRGVKPTIAINPTDGSLGEASGTATLIKARKTEDHLSEGSPYAVYEAIIPPQAAPTAFLNIKIGDKIATVAADVASFGSNKRYVYDITITEFKVNVTSSIASWGYDAGGSQVNADVSNNKAVEIGRPKLPIEYVIGTHNLATATTMAADDDPSNCAYFCWNTTAKASDGPKANIQAMINGLTISDTKYHLPSVYEWMSIVAPYYCATTIGSAVIVGGSDGQRITYKRGLATDMTEAMAWGVTNNNGTYSYDVNRLFYNDYNCPNDGNHNYIGYGLRFKETTGKNGRYTCAYRYEYKTTDTSVGGGASLTVKVKYVGYNQAVTITTISDETWWSSSDFSIVFPACGYSEYINNSDQNIGYYSSATEKTGGLYWSATPMNGTYALGMHFYASYVNGDGYHHTGFGFPVRLFKDAE